MAMAQEITQTIADHQVVVISGATGCGKSTQLGLLYEALSAQGTECVRTKEPTDGPWGQRIRAMARSDQRVAPEEELDWFMQDRRAHVAELIEPALARGAVVLCDRYWLSSVAYQGGRGLDAQAIQRANEEAFPDPDLAMIFEIPPEEGLQRVNARGGVAEPAFEEQEFLSRVARVFAQIDRPWLVRIDARPALEQVSAQVRARVRQLGIELDDQA